MTAQRATLAASTLESMADSIALLRARSDLRKNLLCRPGALDLVKSGCHEAHHIVAWAASRATQARAILALPAVKIDTNSPINGVLLRCGEHRRLHTGDYYDKVNEVLADLPVENSATVSAALRNITAQIEAGTF